MNALDQLVYTGHLVAYSCWCGIRFAMPENLYREYCRKDGRLSVWCPMGHSMTPSGPSVREQLDAAEARTRAAHDQLHASERTVRALRGHLTRLRNRIAAGVCPWCRRSFKQVKAHVRSQHPECVPQMDEALRG